MDDAEHMRAALALARRGLGSTWPNPAVGCVLVRDGRVVGRGSTARGGRLYLGEGVIPVADIVAHLPPVPLSLEIAHLKRQEELGYKEFARQCLQTARAYFERPNG